VEAFIKYLLLHPNPSTQTIMSSQRLHTELVTLIRQSQGAPSSQDKYKFQGKNVQIFATINVIMLVLFIDSLIQLLVDVLPFMANGGSYEVACQVSMACEMASLVSSSDQSAGTVVDVLLSVISHLMNRGLPTTQAVASLYKLLKDEKVHCYTYMYIINCYDIFLYFISCSLLTMCCV